MKIGAEITIKNNHGKSLEKEKLTNRQTNKHSLSVVTGENRSLKRTYERAFAK